MVSLFFGGGGQFTPGTVPNSIAGMDFIGGVFLAKTNTACELFLSPEQGSHWIQDFPNSINDRSIVLHPQEDMALTSRKQPVMSEEVWP